MGFDDITARVAGAASPDAEPCAMVQLGMQQLCNQGANRGESDYHDVLEHPAAPEMAGGGRVPISDVGYGMPSSDADAALDGVAPGHAAAAEIEFDGVGNDTGSSA